MRAVAFFCLAGILFHHFFYFYSALFKIILTYFFPCCLQENMKKVNELTNSPPADDAPASRGAAGTDMMGLLSSMVSADQHRTVLIARATYVLQLTVAQNAGGDVLSALRRGTEWFGMVTVAPIYFSSRARNLKYRTLMNAHTLRVRYRASEKRGSRTGFHRCS